MLADLFLFPDQASTVAPKIDAVYFFIIGVTIFVASVTAVLCIYFAIRYRRRSDDFFPKPINFDEFLISTHRAVTMAKTPKAP